MKFSISTLLVVVACVAVVCWVAAALMPRYGTGLRVDRVPLDSSCPLKQLPADASSVAYHFGGGRNPNTYCEFEIGEGAFLQWINSLPRFTNVSDETNSTYRYNQKTGSPEYRQVADGYFYEWTDPTDGDYGEHVAYDKSNGRAYYQFHRF